MGGWVDGWIHSQTSSNQVLETPAETDWGSPVGTLSWNSPKSSRQSVPWVRLPSKRADRTGWDYIIKLGEGLRHQLAFLTELSLHGWMSFPGLKPWLLCPLQILLYHGMNNSNLCWKQLAFQEFSRIQCCYSWAVLLSSFLPVTELGEQPNSR